MGRPGGLQTFLVVHSGWSPDLTTPICRSVSENVRRGEGLLPRPSFGIMVCVAHLAWGLTVAPASCPRAGPLLFPMSLPALSHRLPAGPFWRTGGQPLAEFVGGPAHGPTEANRSWKTTARIERPKMPLGNPQQLGHLSGRQGQAVRFSRVRRSAHAGRIPAGRAGGLRNVRGRCEGDAEPREGCRRVRSFPSENPPPCRRPGNVFRTTLH